MKPDDFDEGKWGRLVRTPEDYWAFVPNPLPPKLNLTWDLAYKLSAADRAISELAGTARNLPNPHLLIGPFIRREAVLSSRIEGTEASLSDLFFFEAAEPSHARSKNLPPDVHEVANYVNAMAHGLQRLKDLPISLRLIREIHGKLMEGVRGEHGTPGEFRRTQNWIGRPRCTLMEATYVPPPPTEMNQALGDWEKYLHNPSRYPPLINMGLIHYQFEAIHPFLDGNGRIGRLLISLLLCDKELLPQPMLYLSAYFERHRKDYYELLLSVSQSGRWQDWIAFFLEGVAEQAKDAIWRTNRLLDLWHDYRRRLESARISVLLLKLVDDLFEYPVVTISTAAKRLGITSRAASNNVTKLVRANILKEITGRARNRVFVAERIIQIIDEPKTQ